MRPVVITQTGAGTTTGVPLDRNIANFLASVFCHVVAAGTYKIQYTYDSLFDASITPNWIDSTDIPAGTAVDAQSSFNVPVSAVRMVVASGTVTMTVNQSGIV